MVRVYFTVRYWIVLALWLAATAVQAQTPLEVEIEGLDGAMLDNVRLVLSIEQQKQSEDLVEGRIHRLHQKAEAEIRRALEPFGYYRVTIESSLLQEDRVWHAHYRIDRGAPVRMARADVTISGEAVDDEAFTELLAQHPLRLKSPFVHAEYETLKKALQQLAEERGYFEARFSKSEALIDLASYEATVSLHFDSGPRYRFGTIRFSGKQPFSDRFLARYPDFASGDYYEHRLLARLQKVLFASDYFEAVDLQVERKATSDHRIPITVQLTQRPRHRYQLGIGYGTDTGTRGMLGYERRWLNPQGHRFSSELRLSEIRNTVTAQHSVPLAHPASDRLVNRAEYQLDHGGDVDSRRAMLSSTIDRSAGAWRNQWGLSYQLEDFDLGLQGDDSTLLIASAGLSRIQGYDLLQLLRGVRIGVELRGASRDLLSDTDFIQLRLNARSIVPLGKGRFLLRGEGGATGVETVEQLPPSQRFFAGGDNSIRGFAYRSVGPTDASGEVIGGRHFMIGSIEYEHPISEAWRAALFLDGGNAFNNEFIKAEQGAGLGIRRTLPIGVLRVDLAQAISRPERPWRLHLTMGLEL